VPDVKNKLIIAVKTIINKSGFTDLSTSEILTLERKITARQNSVTNEYVKTEFAKNTSTIYKTVAKILNLGSSLCMQESRGKY
jgi:hypothetical protein